MLSYEEACKLIAEDFDTRTTVEIIAAIRAEAVSDAEAEITAIFKLVVERNKNTE